VVQTHQNQPVDNPPAPASPARRAVSVLLLIAGALLGIAGAAVVGLLVIGPLMLGHRQDLPFERLYGNYAVGLLSRLNAPNAPNPVADNPRALRAGRDAYTGSCAVCHGADGRGKGFFGTATYPPATDLTSHDAREKSDGQLFWIIKNGLSFTGMPAFGDQYDDQTIWAMVSYIRALQNRQAPAPAAVPTPTMDQLDRANPDGTAVERGAAVYFAQGCHTCHGPTGNAPGELALRRGGGETAEAIREGRRGMPAYSAGQISDADLADLIAYIDSVAPARSGEEGFFKGGGGEQE